MVLHHALLWLAPACLGGRNIKMWCPSLFHCAFLLPRHGVRSGIPTDLTMASSSGQGVTAVMLARFSTMGDPQRNCEKFIQSSMDSMTASLHLKLQKEEQILCLWSQSGLKKGKQWQLSVQSLLVTKNSQTLYTAFNYQRRSKGTER